MRTLFAADLEMQGIWTYADVCGVNRLCGLTAAAAGEPRARREAESAKAICHAARG
jgi:hypothetical protein